MFSHSSVITSIGRLSDRPARAKGLCGPCDDCAFQGSEMELPKSWPVTGTGFTSTNSSKCESKIYIFNYIRVNLARQFLAISPSLITVLK